MSQGTFFDEPAPPSELETGVGEIFDALDRWQLRLSEEEWAKAVEKILGFLRVTTMEEKPKKRKPTANGRGSTRRR